MTGVKAQVWIQKLMMAEVISLLQFQDCDSVFLAH